MSDPSVRPDHFFIQNWSGRTGFTRTIFSVTGQTNTFHNDGVLLTSLNLRETYRILTLSLIGKYHNILTINSAGRSTKYFPYSLSSCAFVSSLFIPNGIGLSRDIPGTRRSLFAKMACNSYLRMLIKLYALLKYFHKTQCFITSSSITISH